MGRDVRAAGSRFAEQPAVSGRLSDPAAAAEQGQQLWDNSCISSILGDQNRQEAPSSAADAAAKVLTSSTPLAARTRASNPNAAEPQSKTAKVGTRL